MVLYKTCIYVYFFLIGDMRTRQCDKISIFWSVFILNFLLWTPVNWSHLWSEPLFLSRLVTPFERFRDFKHRNWKLKRKTTKTLTERFFSNIILSRYSLQKFWKIHVCKDRGVFSTLSNIYDGVFWGN